ncbi:MAG: ribosome maturation factor RimP [Tetrasphaera sp.]
MSTHEQVAALIAPLVSAHGLVLDDVSVTPAGKRRVLRVSLDVAPILQADGWIDQPTAPVSLDDVAAVSRRIDAALDGCDVLGDAPYVLEVSSPGLGRRLTVPRHFQRNVGRLISIRSASAEVTGRIVRAGADEVVLSLHAGDGQEGETHQTIPYAVIERAVVVVEFGDRADRS